jgi:NitT/TauT family transport system substrate-binding protein
MITTRRSVVLGGVAASLPLPALAQTPLTKVAIGYVTATDFVPILVAKDKGFFASRGIDADPRRIPIMTNIPAGLLSGDLQIGACTMPVLLQANDGGLDLQLISGAARHLKELSKIGLIVRAGLKIEKPQDLVGKKIGVAGFNSTMDVFLRKWLRMKGVDEKQVTRVEAIFPQMPDLLKSGVIDAATITDPFRTMAVNSGAGTIFAEYAAEVTPDVLMVGYMAQGDYARKNPQIVKAFREAIDEANAFGKTNPGETKEIEQKYLGFTSNAPTAWSTAIKSDDLDIYITIGKELGLYRTALDPSKLIIK